MTQKQSFWILVSHLVVALAVLVGATLLCATSKLDSAAVIALYGAAIGLLGGNAQSLGAQVLNGGPKPNLDTLAVQNPTALLDVMQSHSGTMSESQPPQPPLVA